MEPPPRAGEHKKNYVLDIFIKIAIQLGLLVIKVASYSAAFTIYPVAAMISLCFWIYNICKKNRENNDNNIVRSGTAFSDNEQTQTVAGEIKTKMDDIQRNNKENISKSKNIENTPSIDSCSKCNRKFFKIQNDNYKDKVFRSQHTQTDIDYSYTQTRKYNEAKYTQTATLKNRENYSQTEICCELNVTRTDESLPKLNEEYKKSKAVEQFNEDNKKRKVTDKLLPKLDEFDNKTKGTEILPISNEDHKKPKVTKILLPTSNKDDKKSEVTEILLPISNKDGKKLKVTEISLPKLNEYDKKPKVVEKFNEDNNKFKLTDILLPKLDEFDNKTKGTEILPISNVDDMKPKFIEKLLPKSNEDGKKFKVTKMSNEDYKKPKVKSKEDLPLDQHNLTAVDNADGFVTLIESNATMKNQATHVSFSSTVANDMFHQQDLTKQLSEKFNIDLKHNNVTNYKIFVSNSLIFELGNFRSRIETVDKLLSYGNNDFAGFNDHKEFKLYASKLANHKSDISSNNLGDISSEETIEDVVYCHEKDAMRFYRIEKVSFDKKGVVINGRIYISKYSWHTIVVVQSPALYRCAVCSLDVHAEKVSSHMEVGSHKIKLSLHRPLEIYGDSLIREINETTLHCAICNRLFLEDSDHTSGLFHVMQYEIARKNALKTNTILPVLPNQSFPSTSGIKNTGSNKIIQENTKSTIHIAKQIYAHVLQRFGDEAVVVTEDNLNTIMYINKQNNCALCEEDIFIVTEHINSRKHCESMVKHEYLRDYGSNLVREINSSKCHCGICNVIVKNINIKEHIEKPHHVSLLREARNNISCFLRAVGNNVYMGVVLGKLKEKTVITENHISKTEIEEVRKTFENTLIKINTKDCKSKGYVMPKTSPVLESTENIKFSKTRQTRGSGPEIKENLQSVPIGTNRKEENRNVHELNVEMKNSIDRKMQGKNELNKNKTNKDNTHNPNPEHKQKLIGNPVQSAEVLISLPSVNVLIAEESWHGIVLHRIGLNCIYCDICLESNTVSNHIGSLEHAQNIDKYVIEECHGVENLIRTLQKQIHCGICNKVMPNNQVHMHITHLKHANLLSKAKISAQNPKKGIEVIKIKPSRKKQNGSETGNIKNNGEALVNVEENKQVKTCKNSKINETMRNTHDPNDDKKKQIDKKVQGPTEPNKNNTKENNNLNPNVEHKQKPIQKPIQSAEILISLPSVNVLVTEESWHGIVQNCLGINCVYCNLCLESNTVSNHIVSLEHVQKIDKYVIEECYGIENLIRTHKKQIHCGICNKVMPNNQVHMHITHLNHANMLNKAKISAQNPKKGIKVIKIKPSKKKQNESETRIIKNNGEALVKNEESKQGKICENAKKSETVQNVHERNVEKKKPIDKNVQGPPEANKNKTNEDNNLNTNVENKQEPIEKPVKSVEVVISLHSVNVLVTEGSWHGIVHNRVGINCVYCNLCLESNAVSNHILSLEHLQNIDKYVIEECYGIENLIRMVTKQLHCGICNMMIPIKQIHVHVSNSKHAVSLKKAKIAAQNPEQGVKVIKIEPIKKHNETNNTNIRNNQESNKAKNEEFKQDKSDENAKKNETLKKNIIVKSHSSQIETSDEEILNINIINELLEKLDRNVLTKSIFDQLQTSTCENEVLVWCAPRNRIILITNKTYNSYVVKKNSMLQCIMCNYMLTEELKDCTRLIPEHAGYCKHIDINQATKLFTVECLICNEVISDCILHINDQPHKLWASVLAREIIVEVLINPCHPAPLIDNHTMGRETPVYMKGITRYAYEGIIARSADTRRCLLCDVIIEERDLARHLRSTRHVQMDKHKFRNKHGTHLVRTLKSGSLHCCVCNQLMSQNDFEAHIRSKEHQNNLEGIKWLRLKYDAMELMIRKIAFNGIVAVDEHYKCCLCDEVFGREILQWHMENTCHFEKMLSGIMMAVIGSFIRQVKNKQLQTLFHCCHCGINLRGDEVYMHLSGLVSHDSILIRAMHYADVLKTVEVTPIISNDKQALSNEDLPKTSRSCDTSNIAEPGTSASSNENQPKTLRTNDTTYMEENEIANMLKEAYRNLNSSLKDQKQKKTIISLKDHNFLVLRDPLHTIILQNERLCQYHCLVCKQNLQEYEIDKHVMFDSKHRSTLATKSHLTEFYPNFIREIHPELFHCSTCDDNAVMKDRFQIKQHIMQASHREILFQAMHALYGMTSMASSTFLFNFPSH